MDCTGYPPGIGTFSFTVENSAFVHFALAIANRYYSAVFDPPGTHHCWVCRGSIEWEVCLTLVQMTISGNWTIDISSFSPTRCPPGHMLPAVSFAQRAGFNEEDDRIIKYILLKERWHLNVTRLLWEQLTVVLKYTTTGHESMNIAHLEFTIVFSTLELGCDFWQ